MTKNQIEYWRNAETKRNNLAIEKETNRANLAREKWQNKTAEETERHNRETERLGRDQFSLAMAQHRNELYMQSISNALNARRQAEVERSNRANEKNTQQRIVYDYTVGATNAQTARMTVEEQRRSNSAYEEYRTKSLQETQRHNQELETLGLMQNEEIARSNLANEAIKTAETGIKQQQVSLDSQRLQEQARHNSVVEQETHRANVSRESIDQWNATANLMRASSSIVNSLDSLANNHGSSLGKKVRNSQWERELRKMRRQ